MGQYVIYLQFDDASCGYFSGVDDDIQLEDDPECAKCFPSEKAAGNCVEILKKTYFIDYCEIYNLDDK